VLGNTLAERKKREEKIARDIKNAKVKFNFCVPCLLTESLIRTIGNLLLKHLSPASGQNFLPRLIVSILFTFIYQNKLMNLFPLRLFPFNHLIHVGK